MMDKEKKFLDNVRQVMDESVQELDGATLSRLAQARNAALDRKRRMRRKAFTWGTPAAGLAAAAIIAVIMLRPGPPVPVEETFVADLEILASEETIEFYEDLEFYEWLSEVEGALDENGISRGRSCAPGPVAARSRAGTERHDDERDAEHGDAGVSRLV